MMFAKQISIQKTEADLEQLLQLVGEGAEITIMNGNKTIAKIISAESHSSETIHERILGAHPGAWMSEDFDAPLPETFW